MISRGLSASLFLCFQKAYADLYPKSISFYLKNYKVSDKSFSTSSLKESLLNYYKVLKRVKQSQ